MDIAQHERTVPAYSPAVRYRQFYVEGLTASGREFPTRGGNLMVVQHDDHDQLDWELVIQTNRLFRIDQAPYTLLISGPEGNFSGPAILVRSDGTSHVFRGAGDLGGFVERDFDG